MEVAEALAREAGALVRDGRRRLVDRGGDEVQRPGRGDGDGPRVGGAAAQPARRAAAATTRSSARRRPSGPAPPASPGWWTRSTAPSTTSTGPPPTRCRSRPWSVPTRRPPPTRRRGPRSPGACSPRRTAGRSPAGRGLGATLDGVGLRVGAARPLIDSLVGTGFGYVASRRRVQGRIVAELLPQVRDIRRVGSCGARPVRDRRRRPRPVLRAGPAAVGPRGRRARRPGGRRAGHGAAGAGGAGGDDGRGTPRARSRSCGRSSRRSDADSDG